MKEQDLVDKIKAYLSKQPNTFHWKEHGGVYGTAVIPDIIVCYKGKFVGLECKAKGRKPTVLQQITINKINRAGGIAKVVYDLEEVKELLKNLD